MAAPSGGATLVLRLASLPANQRLYKAIAKSGAIVKCEPPKDLAGWIVQRGKAGHSLAVQPEAARVLADYVGDDLSRLDNELGEAGAERWRGTWSGRPTWRRGWRSSGSSSCRRW